MKSADHRPSEIRMVSDKSNGICDSGRAAPQPQAATVRIADNCSRRSSSAETSGDEWSDDAWDD